MNFRNAGFSQEEDIRIDVTPLIDMMFQFLVFFLLTTSFVSNSGFDVQLPKSSSAQLQMQEMDLIVAVDASGRILYDQEPYSDEAFKGVLEAEHGKRPDVTVIIQADAAVVHGRVITVMDMIRTAGFAKLAVATMTD